MRFRFAPPMLRRPGFTPGDALIVLALAALLALGLRLGWRAPAILRGPTISLSPWALPLYALLSTARMAAAYRGRAPRPACPAGRRVSRWPASMRSPV